MSSWELEGCGVQSVRGYCAGPLKEALVEQRLEYNKARIRLCPSNSRELVWEWLCRSKTALEADPEDLRGADSI